MAKTLSFRKILGSSCTEVQHADVGKHEVDMLLKAPFITGDVDYHEIDLKGITTGVKFLRKIHNR